MYYVGEVKTIPINELAKQFPHLTQSDLEDIIQTSSVHTNDYQHSGGRYRDIDNNQVHLISDRQISAYYVVNATRKDVPPLEVEI